MGDEKQLDASDAGCGKPGFSVQPQGSGRSDSTGPKTGLKVAGAQESEVDDGGTKSGRAAKRRGNSGAKHGRRPKARAKGVRVDDPGPKHGRSARRLTQE